MRSASRRCSIPTGTRPLPPMTGWGRPIATCSPPMWKTSSVADFLFEPHAPVSIPIARGGLFAVRRVYCVGRNYAEHIIEMGNDTRDPPFFFAKPADAVVVGGVAI